MIADTSMYPPFHSKMRTLLLALALAACVDATKSAPLPADPTSAEERRSIDYSRTDLAAPSAHGMCGAPFVDTNIFEPSHNKPMNLVCGATDTTSGASGAINTAGSTTDGTSGTVGTTNTAGGIDVTKGAWIGTGLTVDTVGATISQGGITVTAGG